MLKQGSYFYYCSRIITRQFSPQQGLDLGQRMLTGWPGLRARGCWGLRGQGAWALGSTCWHSHSLPLWLCFLCAMRPASPALPVLSCAMMTSDLMHGHSFSFGRKRFLLSPVLQTQAQRPKDLRYDLVTTFKTQKRKHAATSETPAREAQVLIQVLAGRADPQTSSPVPNRHPLAVGHLLKQCSNSSSA